MKIVTKILISICLFALHGCTEEEVSTNNSNPLIERKDGVETIWYPGKKQVRYRREYDSKNKRHGKWMFYNPEGKVQSSSFYDHGKRTGVWIVNYPNGQLNYSGEYKNDNPFGIWLFYSKTGDKLKEITYDENGKVLKEEKFESKVKQKDLDTTSKEKDMTKN